MNFRKLNRIQIFNNNNNNNDNSNNNNSNNNNNNNNNIRKLNCESIDF